MAGGSEILGCLPGPEAHLPPPHSDQAEGGPDDNHAAEVVDWEVMGTVPVSHQVGVPLFRLPNPDFLALYMGIKDHYEEPQAKVGEDTSGSPPLMRPFPPRDTDETSVQLCWIRGHS